jgi:threonine aldolase
MYNFTNDYCETCSPRILETLSKTNFDQEDGYGNDSFSKKARELIKNKIVLFLSYMKIEWGLL